ncbi:hypothetical protein GCM10018966_027270 [Streptomyces yanii]
MNAPAPFFMMRDSGSVKLACALSFGHRLGFVGPGTLLASPLLVLGVLAGLLGGLGLDLRAGGLQPGQALFPAVEFVGQVCVLAVGPEPLVLGGIESLGAGAGKGPGGRPTPPCCRPRTREGAPRLDTVTCRCLLGVGEHP